MKGVAMKDIGKKGLNAVLCLIAGVLSIGLARLADAGDTPLPYKGVSYNFYDFEFIDAKCGWICGKSGYLFHTQDGGLIWRKSETAVDASIFGVRFFDTKRGVLAGQGGLIMVTDDGGVRWKKVEAPVDKSFLTLDFYDDKTGMAAGDWGKIIVTHDGGKSWEDTSLAEDVVLYDLKYTGPEEVWICGEMGNIFHSTDGGKSWEKKTVAEGTLFAIDMDKQKNGLVVGIDGVVLRTKDGGQTWEKSQITREGLYNVQINGDTAVAIGDAGAIFSMNLASDTSWRQIEVPVELKANWLQCIQKLGDGRFIIAGANGSISFIEEGKLVRPDI